MHNKALGLFAIATFLVVAAAGQQINQFTQVPAKPGRRFLVSGF